MNYNLGDKVWYIHQINHSRLPRIVQVEIERKKTVEWENHVYYQYDISYDMFKEQDIPSHLLYKTKEELLNSL